MLSTQEFLDKWSKRTKAAVPDYTAGVNRVTVAPGVKAAAQQDAFAAGIAEAIQSGRWARNVSKVGLEDWKDKAAKVGSARISAGVDAATPKMQDTVTKLLQTVAAGQASIANTPRGNLEQNIARMTGFVRYMAEHPVK